jgi:pilus assembly protein Flp/PilA
VAAAMRECCLTATIEQVLARYTEYNSLHRIQQCPVLIASARGRIAAEQIRGSTSKFSRPITQRRYFPGDTQMLAIFRRLMKNEHGATAIEYTLIASLIAVAAIAAFTTVGHKISNVMSNVAGNMG